VGVGLISTKRISFFHDNFAGALTKKVVGYAKYFETLTDTLSFNVLSYVLPLFFAAFVLWRYSWILVAALFGMLALTFSIIVPLTRRRKKLVDIREAASNSTAGYVADILGNMDTVKAFAREDYEKKLHYQNVNDYMQKAVKSWDYHVLRVDGTIGPLYVLTNTLGLALAITLSSGNATVTAKIFVTFTYFIHSTFILWQFNRTYRTLENSIAEAAQFTELLLKDPSITEAPSSKALKITKGEIEFKNVDFQYAEQDRDKEPLFSSFNLRIAPGEKLALVGHSGGGKTTITKLLLRFVDIRSGELLIDGQDIRSARLSSVRGSIAYVPQEPSMFHRSIRENIRYGRLNATDKEVIEAAKKAHAHEFISKLPRGYDTLVGERGVKLSGGQRQRIAIARAIIKNAPILVLDEATSALDSESEKLIQDALREVMEGRTTIVIAHRLSTIQKMDRIVVLENGAIMEEGPHKDLLAKDGTYAKLWAHQSGGFIEE
jgi:ATP-binding cassette, subfamily B, bacterial